MQRVEGINIKHLELTEKNISSFCEKYGANMKQTALIRTKFGKLLLIAFLSKLPVQNTKIISTADEKMY